MYQEWPRQTKPKKGQFMNFSQGHSGTKVQCESCLLSQGKTPEFTKMGETHELFVLALSLVWFAGATPECSVMVLYTRLSKPRLEITGETEVTLSCRIWEEGKELGPQRNKGLNEPWQAQSLQLNFPFSWGRWSGKEKRAQRLTLWARRLPGGVGGLPREGVGVEKFVPSLEVCLGFRWREAGMSREFCRDVPDPWGCSKSLCKKDLCAFFAP